MIIPWLGLFKNGKSKTAWALKEEQFILAINSIKTLQVTPNGGMSIEPEEIMDKVIHERKRLQYLVRRDGH